jgi:hypothetical protein
MLYNHRGFGLESILELQHYSAGDLNDYYGSIVSALKNRKLAFAAFKGAIRRYFWGDGLVLS